MAKWNGLGSEIYGHNVRFQTCRIVNQGEDVIFNIKYIFHFCCFFYLPVGRKG